MEKRKSIEMIYFIPIAIILAIIPLIVIEKTLKISGLEMYNWKGGSTHKDYFSYYKSLVFIVSIYGSFILLFIQQVFNRIKIKLSWIYSPIIVYIGFVMLSTMKSEYLPVSLMGFIEQFQGVWVLIGYGLAVIVSYNMVNTERDLRLVYYSISFSMIGIFIIGFSQYFGFDLLNNSTIQKIILFTSEDSNDISLKFLSVKNTISATLYNENYVGSYSALLLPVFYMWYFYKQSKITECCLGVLSCIVFFLLIGSKSRSGYIAFFFTSVIFFYLAINIIKINFKKFGILMVAFTLIILIMNFYGANSIYNRFNQLSLPKEIKAFKDDTVRFVDLRFDKHNLHIVTTKDSLSISERDGIYSFTDDEGNPLVPFFDDGYYVFSEDRYSDYRIEFTDKNYFRAYVHGQILMIFNLEEGFMLYDIGSTLNVTEYPEYFEPLIGKEKLFSGRGYIWMASIPLLKGSLIYGYGPGMYPIVFPQQDYVGKMNMSIARFVVDKPHNMYLQIGIENGLIALISLLTIYIFYFIRSIQIYKKIELKTLTDYAGLGIFLGITGYLISGFFNDQVISVAPIFYILLGTGLSVNEILYQSYIKTL